jgi:D-glycero-alpha-D-manno-heptose-7-phosphate kinase
MFSKSTKPLLTARAPLRLGLAGGGTDVDPYASMHGGFVLNATISRYAYTFVSELNDGYVELEAQDRAVFWRGKYEEIDSAPDELRLHKAAIRRVVGLAGKQDLPSVKISTLADAPVGSGLGTSSTVVVSLVQALSDLLHVPLGEYDLARLAYEIERVDCGLAGGAQDQYAAAFGGVNFMEFYANQRVIVNPLRIKDSTLCDLEASLVLYFTGVSRESSAIIDAQRENVVKSKTDAVNAMHEVKMQAIQMKEALLLGDIDQLASSLQVGWLAKKRMAANVSNAAIDDIYERAVASGALAGKVSGAGGGGFMMFLVDPSKRIRVIRELEKAGGEIFPCGFSKRGAISWRA